jgi:hypothetical protein
MEFPSQRWGISWAVVEKNFERKSRLTLARAVRRLNVSRLSFFALFFCFPFTKKGWQCFVVLINGITFFGVELASME